VTAADAAPRSSWSQAVRWCRSSCKANGNEQETGNSVAQCSCRPGKYHVVLTAHILQAGSASVKAATVKHLKGCGFKHGSCTCFFQLHMFLAHVASICNASYLNRGIQDMPGHGTDGTQRPHLPSR
jgi:hypothetical protein